MIEGARVERFFPDAGRRATRAATSTIAHPHEGRDAQPPDRDLAVSRARPPARAARSATRARPAAAPSPRPASPASPCRTCASPAPMQPWEERPRQARTASLSALAIMLEGPIGGAAFNNEFGRPNLGGYFRTFEHGGRRARCAAITSRSCSPAASATSRAEHVAEERRSRRGTLLIVSSAARRMLIGLGGGAASSMATGANAGGPRLRFGAARQRRDASGAARKSSTAAGRWATTTRSCRSTTSAPAACRTRCPSSCNGAGRGARFDLRAVPQRGAGHVAAWRSGATRRRSATCWRSRRALPSVRGALRARALPVRGGRRRHRRRPAACVDDRAMLARRAGRHADWTCCSASRRRCTRDVTRVRARRPTASTSRASTCSEAAYACCGCRPSPTRRFLITIGDRTVGGLIAPRPDGRPVAGAGGRRARSPPADYDGYTGEAMAMGERTPLALHRRAGLRAHGGRRGAHQPRRGAASQRSAT